MKTKTAKKTSGAPKVGAKKSVVAKAPAKKSAAKKALAKRPAAKAPARRADFGAPIEGFFAKARDAGIQALLDRLRALVAEVAPEATASLKWGMPFYALGTAPLCAIAGHKAHVNLIFSGPPGTFADPKGLLSGDGETGRHLRLTAVADIPEAAVRGWLRAAMANAKKKG